MTGVTDYSFKYESRDDARTGAAEEYGYDLDEIIIKQHPETHKWGWILEGGDETNSVGEDTQQEESDDLSPETENEVEAGDEGHCRECGQEAFIDPDGVSHHSGDTLEGVDHDADADHVAVVEKSEPEQQIGPRLVVNNVRPVEDAQPGDVILQAGGPNLLFHQRSLAVTFAKRLGLQITLRDATTYEVVSVVKPTEGGSGKGGGGYRAPTPSQEKIIELCTRATGASSAELLEGGAAPNMEKNRIPWLKMVEACQRFGYTLKVEPRRQGNRFVSVYFLVPTDEQHGEAAD